MATTRNSILFAESLPDDCPPIDAEPPAAQKFIRFADGPTPSAVAFLSYTGLGKPVNGGASLCQYASCSMLTVKSRGELRALWALPKYRRFSHAMIVDVHPGAGLAKIGKKGHVDVWLYASFNAVAAVSATVAQGEA